MTSNNKVKNYIEESLEGFNDEFVQSVCRCFEVLEYSKEPNGCLSNTAALYICAKECGYNPEICYGLCELKGSKFYHAWLVVNDTIIDIAIFGNVNYSPYSLWNFKVETPYIGSYSDSPVHYGKFEFDEGWMDSDISMVEGWTLEKYMNVIPDDAMWRLTCLFLNKAPSHSYIEHLKSYAKGIKIEKK